MSKRVNLNAIKLHALNPYPEVEISDNTTLTSFSSGNGVDRPFTISYWVKVQTVDFDGTGKGLHSGTVYSKYNRLAPKQVEMEIYIGSGQLKIFLYADPEQNGNAGAAQDLGNHLMVGQGPGNNRFYHEAGKWFHTCITYDGSQELTGFRIYKNSHPVGQAAFTDDGVNTQPNPALDVPDQVFFGRSVNNNYSGMMQTTIPTTLGGIHQNDSVDKAFAGTLADVCRFNRVLTHAEVQELYNGGKVKNMEEHSAYADLVHWWKMGDDLDKSGTNGIIDYVGGYHGTLQDGAKIIADPSLPTDRIGNNGVITHSSWGRTGQPKNIAGDQQVFIHGGISGDMPTADPDANTVGFTTENQRYLHLYWKKEAANSVNITVFGYSHSSGQWSALPDVSLSTTNAAADTYRIFEIAGVDKVYFKQSGAAMASTDLFAAACSSKQ